MKGYQPLQRSSMLVEELMNPCEPKSDREHAAVTEIYKLQDRIKELEQALQWQPIETAPKDGTKVLAFDINLPSNGVYITWFAEKYGTSQWASDSTNDFGGWETPTHWRPLPGSHEPMEKP